MKNLLFMGAVALLLFSLSAALSLWLNQSKEAVVAVEKDPKEKAVPPKPADHPKDPVDPKKVPPLPPPASDPLEPGLLDDKARLERKRLQISMVLADVQAQREATDALLKQVTLGLKDATKPLDPDPNAPKLPNREEIAKREKETFTKLASVYDAMTPEGAAKILKQMAESGTGKMEQAAQILAFMKDRNSARLLEALEDPALAAQLFDKMRQLKGLNAATATAPAPAPSALPGGLTPARGP